ncbi:MAG: hypothetical protein K0S37_780 [Microbacterium sp.]|jgi:hypothetical protein|nr:hypothetical protein [Microbacterium sp.]
MKLNAEQERVIAKLLTTNKKLRNAKETADARIRALVHAELRAIEKEQEELVVTAVALRIPKAAIARDGLQTTSRGDVYDILKSAQLNAAIAEETAALGTDPQAAEFELVEGGAIRIRPAADVLAKLLPSLGFVEGSAIEPLLEAEFAYVDGRLLSNTEAWTTANGRNPVVALVLADGEYRGRAISWLQSKGVAA